MAGDTLARSAQFRSRTARLRIEPSMAIETVHLSGVIKRPLVDVGRGIGKVEDLVVRMGAARTRPSSALVVKIGGRELFVPVDKISAIEPGRVTFDGRQGRPAPLRAPARRAPLGPGPPGAPPHQPRRRPAHPGQRDRAGPHRRHGGRWSASTRRPGLRCAACCPAASGSIQPPAPSSTGAASSPSCPTCPTARLRIPYRKLARLHPPRSPTWWRRPRTRRARRSSRRSGQDRGARGRRLRGARPRAPGRVRPGPLRRRGRPAARGRWRPTTPPT